jgi:hypothetical protein
MPLRTFPAARHDVDVQSAVLELIGQRLREVFQAGLEPPSDRLARCLRRIEEGDSRGGAPDGAPAPKSRGPSIGNNAVGEI